MVDLFEDGFVGFVEELLVEEVDGCGVVLVVGGLGDC